MKQSVDSIDESQREWYLFILCDSTAKIVFITVSAMYWDEMVTKVDIPCIEDTSTNLSQWTGLLAHMDFLQSKW